MPEKSRPPYAVNQEPASDAPDETGTTINRDRVAADWADRGFGCDLWVDLPGRCWKDFTHPTDELVLVLEGEMEFEVEGQKSRPQPGEELLIPSGCRHSARNVGQSTARWLYGYRSA